jgi:hypothetical protein
MWIQFERVIASDEAERERLSRYIADLRFVHYLLGPSSEVWGHIATFLKERYEGYFYLVDFEEDSFLIASTVPLRLPVTPSQLWRIRGKRERVIRRIKLHFLDPTSKAVSLHRSINLSLASIIVTVAGVTALLWLRDFVTLFLVLPMIVLHMIPGDNRLPVRRGNRVVVKKKGRTTVLISRILNVLFTLWVYWNIWLRYVYSDLRKSYLNAPEATAASLVIMLVMLLPVIALYLWMKKSEDIVAPEVKG